MKKKADETMKEVANIKQDELSFDNLNMDVSHDRLVEDALYFFPNPNSTAYAPQAIPSPYSYPIMENFTDRMLAAAHSERFAVPGEAKKIFDDEYKYWYYKENKDILIDHVASVIATNATNILFNGTLTQLYIAGANDYRFRYPFAIPQYDIALIIRDFMESTEFMGENVSQDKIHSWHNICATQTVLNSQIMRCIAEKVNDYVRQIIFDPDYPIVVLIDKLRMMGKNDIFTAIPEEIITDLVANQADTLYMIAFGCIQDYINWDMLKISEAIETSLVFLFDILTKIVSSYNSN